MPKLLDNASTETTSEVGVNGYQDNWQKTNSAEDIYFTADEVIDAYYKGIAEGLRKEERAALIKLQENVTISAHYRDKICSYLKSEGFSPSAAYLKIGSWDNFTILITLPEKEFGDNKFLQAYKKITSIEKELREKSIFLFFCFTATGEGTLNEGLMASDGYALKHNI